MPQHRGQDVVDIVMVSVVEGVIVMSELTRSRAIVDLSTVEGSAAM